MARVTANTMPGSTPSPSTPTVVSRHSQNSKRLSVRMVLSDLMSISPQPAISSTAPSAACGIQAMGR
jgi:hypothetical protein